MCLTFLRKWHESMASDVTSGALHGDQMGAGVRRGGTGLVARALHDVRQQMAAGIRLKVVARHQIRCLLTAAAASGAKLVATLCCRAAASFPPDHCLIFPPDHCLISKWQLASDCGSPAVQCASSRHFCALSDSLGSGTGSRGCNGAAPRELVPE